MTINVVDWFLSKILDPESIKGYFLCTFENLLVNTAAA